MEEFLSNLNKIFKMEWEKIRNDFFILRTKDCQINFYRQVNDLESENVWWFMDSPFGMVTEFHEFDYPTLGMIKQAKSDLFDHLSKIARISKEAVETIYIADNRAIGEKMEQDYTKKIIMDQIKELRRRFELIKEPLEKFVKLGNYFYNNQGLAAFCENMTTEEKEELLQPAIDIMNECNDFLESMGM